MRSLAVVVPRRAGEEVRRDLARDGLLRDDLRIRAEARTVAFPIRAPPARLPEGAEVRELDFEAAPPSPPKSYREGLSLDPEEAALLPSGYDVIGDIVLIRLPPELEGRAPEIGEALRSFVPGTRIVGIDRGVEGPRRIRRIERIAGTGGWETRHTENRLSLDVDLERAYFSPRLAHEHEHVARGVRPGESVFDLCCGVGPFSLGIARDGRARRVVAVDSNPDALRLLRANARRLGLEARIEAVEAPIEAFLPTAGRADRVIFNLPREGIKYVSQVASSVERGGTLHYYEMTERSSVTQRPDALRELAVSGSGSPDWTVGPPRTVHPYSPSADLVAYTLIRGPG